MAAIAFLLTAVACLLHRNAKLRNENLIVLELLKREFQSGSGMIDNLAGIVTEVLHTTTIAGSSTALLAKRLVKNFSYKQSNVKSVVRMLPSLVEFHCHGLISNLKSICPTLSDKELIFCSLVALGLPPACICMVFGFDSLNTVYNNSSRIRAKLGVRRETDIYAFMADRIQRLKEEQKKALDESIEKSSLEPLLRNFK